MATFGSIGSPFANVLFNPVGMDQAAQATQRNRLMMDQSRESHAGQQFDRDISARQSMARELSALPEQEAAAQWGTYRQRLQSAGLGMGLPEQFPGMERLRAVASSDLTTFQRMQIEEKRRATEAMAAGFGLGGVPAGPAAAPVGAAMPPAASPAGPPAGPP